MQIKKGDWTSFTKTTPGDFSLVLAVDLQRVPRESLTPGGIPSLLVTVLEWTNVRRGVTRYPRTPSKTRNGSSIMIQNPKDIIPSLGFPGVRVKSWQCEVMIALAGCDVIRIYDNGPRVYLQAFGGLTLIYGIYSSTTSNAFRQVSSDHPL
jgi:hypothetical protein